MMRMPSRAGTQVGASKDKVSICTTLWVGDPLKIHSPGLTLPILDNGIEDKIIKVTMNTRI